jgi:BirA family transcriptional regulator, biotin operon repressor / biotin---[acetyl-CoA-carboxylase] ligase
VKNPRIHLLSTKRIGRRLLQYDRVESTNLLALELAKDRANDGVAVLAMEQTAGRGRYGRNWHCPPDAGVLLSLVVFAPTSVRRPVLLTAWAATSVAEVIRSASGLDARLKWPNDVLVGGKKVCGILIEHGTATVVGIGLNVNQTDDDLRGMELTEASSLFLCSGRRFDVSEIARTLIQQLDASYDEIQSGALGDLESRWRTYLDISNREVVVTCQETVNRGRVRKLDWDALQLDVPEEGIVHIRPESITQLEVVESEEFGRVRRADHDP